MSQFDFEPSRFWKGSILSIRFESQTGFRSASASRCRDSASALRSAMGSLPLGQFLAGCEVKLSGFFQRDDGKFPEGHHLLFTDEALAAPQAIHMY